MPGTTTKGVPYSLGADAASTIDTVMQTLAQWVDDNPGTASLTTVARNALAGADLWAGRRVWDTTLGQYVKYTGAAWVAEHVVDQTGTTGRVGADPSAAYGVGYVEKNAATASGDIIGGYEFYAKDSGGNRTRYARIEARAVDNTNGTEDGDLRLYAFIAGVETEIARIGSISGLTALQLMGNIMSNNDGSRTLRWGTGTPEGVVTAAVGSGFWRTDGGVSTTLYIKETGAGNTGWKSVGGGASPLEVQVFS